MGTANEPRSVLRGGLRVLDLMDFPEDFVVIKEPYPSVIGIELTFAYFSH